MFVVSFVVYIVLCPRYVYLVLGGLYCSDFIVVSCTTKFAYGIHSPYFIFGIFQFWDNLCSIQDFLGISCVILALGDSICSLDFCFFFSFSCLFLCFFVCFFINVFLGGFIPLLFLASLEHPLLPIFTL